VFDRSFDSWRWWWCALSGLLLVAGFPPFSCATCGWIALIPAWWVVTRSEQVRRRPFRHGYVVGLIFFGAVFWWISNVTVVGTVFLVLYLPLYPALWFLLVARLIDGARDGTRGWVLVQAFAAASLWVMLEWWRSWFLTGFNWNELGVSQAPSIVFRQLAAFGGVPLISFVLVTVNVLWAEGLLAMAATLQEKKVVRASFPFATALFVVAVCFALGIFHLESINTARSSKLNFACIQPNIPQIAGEGGDYEGSEEAALETAEHLSLEAEAAAVKPDLLIWPEAFTGEEIFHHRFMNQVVHQVASSSDRYFLVGAQDSDIQPLRIYNCAYLFGPGWDAYQYYRKTHLVLFGEFFPFADDIPGFRKWAGVGIDMTPGPGPKVFTMDMPGIEKARVTFAPFICFEDTLPEVADKAVRVDPKPDFFVTITNDGWYTGWFAQWGVRQHLANALFRCVEHDRPMIRCANTGISCVIDQNGTVVSRYEDAAGHDIDVGGVYAEKLQYYETHETLYEKWGDWIILISGVVSVMLCVRFFARTRAR
jgi:apolipoprotein N-acyltransferase